MDVKSILPKSVKCSILYAMLLKTKLVSFLMEYEFSLIFSSNK